MKELIIKLDEYKENLDDLIFATDMQLREMDPESSGEDRLITWYSQGTIAAYKDIQKIIEKGIDFLGTNINKTPQDISRHLLDIAFTFYKKREGVIGSLKNALKEKNKRHMRGQADCYNDMLVAYLKSFAVELDVREDTDLDWIEPYKPHFII
ncbi:MAG TPA: hypothetical protein VFD15_03185 [Clostridia bacterium]|nr:hypothetical protein [Clostridia bacterium]